MPGSVLIAISHVWAYGMGNPYASSLSVCLILYLQRLVNQLHSVDTPFWIDTFCIPRSPPALKTEALLRMREPHEQSSKVLVIDSYLRNYTAFQVPLIEILAQIAVCGWSQRLWTFQEGRMAAIPARVVFAFKDRLIDLLDELKTPHCHFPTSASHAIYFELLSSHRQTLLHVSAGLKEEDLYSMCALREALRLTILKSRRSMKIVINSLGRETWKDCWPPTDTASKMSTYL